MMCYADPRRLDLAIVKRLGSERLCRRRRCVIYGGSLKETCQMGDKAADRSLERTLEGSSVEAEGGREFGGGQRGWCCHDGTWSRRGRVRSGSCRFPKVSSQVE